MTKWLKDWSEIDIRSLRFALGLTLATILAFTIAWKLSFLTVILVGKLLSTDKPYLSLQEGLMLIVIIAAAMFAGLLLSVLVVYPLVFLLVIFLLLLLVFFLGTQGASPMLVIMLLVGFTVIPIVGMQSFVLSYELMKAFILSSALAVILTWVAYAMVPDREISVKANSDIVKNDGNYESAMNSTLVVMPLFLVIYIFNMSGSVLILVFVAILAQNTQLQAGIKAGAGLLMGNLIGGVIVLTVYNLLVAIPSLGFFILLMAAVWFHFAQQLFAGGKKAALYGIALSTVVVVLGSALGLMGTEASEKFYTRFYQLMAVAVYIIMAFTMLEAFRSRSVKKESMHVQAVS